jgi:hypothetical protein
MSNPETMQLDLFEGKILTNDQRLEIQQYISKCDKEVVRKREENIKIQLLLDRAGFREGIDYVNDFGVDVKTYDHEFGYSYNNTEWVGEVEVMRSSGGCQILFDSFRNGKIEMGKSYVSREGDKLQCTSITSQYRYYKPSSLLTKLKEHNSYSLGQLESTNKRQNIIEYTVEKYTKLFPNSEVKIGSDYNRSRNNYTEFKTVIINFPSGSYVIYRLGYNNDGEYLHKKFDNVVDTLKGMDLLNHFNNQ